MLTTRFEEALAEAAKLHRPQLRKGTTTPYISHLMAVAGLCLKHGEALWSRFNTDKAGTIWYYRRMVERLRETGFEPALLVAELERTIEMLADPSDAAPAQPMSGSPMRPTG